MRAGLVRAAVLALLMPLALGGAFGHVDGFELLSHGTFLFPPDHPAHAPFVPDLQRSCVACAVANLSVPAAVPLFLVPPVVTPAFEVRAEHLALAPGTPEIPGRSPPRSPA
ncbi:MAG TPA: hypothetical protein VF395_12465 [Polyangiaceae bacterium]